MKSLLRILFIIIAFLLLAVAAFSIFKGYDSFLDTVLEALGKTGKKEKAIEFLTPQRFIYIQTALGILSLLFFTLSVKVGSLLYYCQRFLFYTKLAVVSVLSDIATWKGLLVLILPLFASVYFAATIPVTIDEAFTFNNFSDKAFYVPFIYYPAPNNHILHSVLTNLSVRLLFIDTLFALRLPTVISSVLLWMVAYSFVKRNYSEKIAIFVVSVSSMIFISIYYSYTSRGYALMMLMFLIGLYSVYGILRHGSKNKYWMFFGVSTILGLYTMPTYMYPLLTLNIILLVFKYNYFKKIIQCNLIAAVITFLLYLPIFLLNNMEEAASVATDNPDQSPFISRMEFLQSLPYFLDKIQSFMFGIPGYVTLGLLLLSVLLLVVQRKKQDTVILFIFYLVPVLLHIIFPVVPLERTFIYMAFITIFFFGVSLSRYISKINIIVLFSITLPIQVAGFIYSKNEIPVYEDFNTFVKQTHDAVLEEGKTYYMPYSLSMNDIIFEMKVRGYDPEKYLFCDFKATEADADTIYNYDYVIIEKAKDHTKFRTPYYSNNFQNVYKR